MNENREQKLQNIFQKVKDKLIKEEELKPDYKLLVRVDLSDQFNTKLLRKAFNDNNLISDPNIDLDSISEDELNHLAENTACSLYDLQQEEISNLFKETELLPEGIDYEICDTESLYKDDYEELSF